MASALLWAANPYLETSENIRNEIDQVVIYQKDQALICIDDVTSCWPHFEKVAKSSGSSEGDGGGDAKTIEGVQAEENQAENYDW